MTESASCSALSASAWLLSPAASSSFSAATSAISAAALVSSFAPLALPISFDAALRRACASCSRVTTLRRASSSAISSPENLTSPPGSIPRFLNPASNACGLSRIHLISNTTLASRSNVIPAQAGSASPPPATKALPSSRRGGRAMRPRLRSAIADIAANATADLSRWTHRVGVTGRTRDRHPHLGTPSNLARPLVHVCRSPWASQVRGVPSSPLMPKAQPSA